ncbi:hypothetical protein VULLAG_LOCUS3390 [Vulpes lagopus]
MRSRVRKRPLSWALEENVIREPAAEGSFAVIPVSRSEGLRKGASGRAVSPGFGSRVRCSLRSWGWSGERELQGRGAAVSWSSLPGARSHRGQPQPVSREIYRKMEKQKFRCFAFDFAKLSQFQKSSFQKDK